MVRSLLTILFFYGFFFDVAAQSIEEIKQYPNPVVDTSFFELTMNQTDSVKVKLHTVNGLQIGSEINFWASSPIFSFEYVFIDTLPLGIYFFTLTSTNSQEVVKVIRSAVSTGVSGKKVSQLYLYPNPTQNIVYLGGIVDATGAAFRVFNVCSQLVLKGQVNLNKIDLTRLESGWYWIQIETPNEHSYVVNVIKGL